MKTKIKYCVVAVIALVFFGCENNDASLKQDCVRGRYVGPYCEGIVVEILDDHKIGQYWKSTYGTETYSNSVVASIDTTLLRSLSSAESYFMEDSIFFFQYRDGGYARKLYNVCDPSPFITIFFVSKNSCDTDENG